MNKKLRKAAELVFFAAVVVLSVVIFLLRDKISDVGELGYMGLFLLCFLANCTVLLPAPSLMIAASCALIMNPLLVALFAALGSTAGELVGYAFGTVSKDLSPRFQRILDAFAARIHNQTLLVFLFAVLPLPLFDLVGIYSGGTKMNLIKFFIVCFLGKFIKMLIYTRSYDLLNWASSQISG